MPHLSIEIRKNKLRQLIAYAKSLGFADDVTHYTAELKKLEETTNG